MYQPVNQDTDAKKIFQPVLQESAGNWPVFGRDERYADANANR